MQVTSIFSLAFYLYVLSLYSTSASDVLNADCQLNNNKTGKCIHIKDCEGAVKQMQNHLGNPIICGYVQLQPVVCCDKSDRREVGKISNQKCEELYKDSPKIIQEVSLIIGYGGINSEPRKFTHMAALGFNDQNETLWLCGGSLISENYVLTAAHCIKTTSYGNVTLIRLGDLNLKTTTDDAEPQNFRIKRTIVHPDFKRPVAYNDIALIELDGKARFTKHVRPVCLHTECDNYQNDLSATGWGVTAYDGPTADHLQLMRLEPFSATECETAYKDISKRRMPKGIDHDKQFCAGHHSMDTCQGDSGGPLQMKNNFNHGYTLIGITSLGKPCGLTKSPGVYTRVCHYIEWIESIVWPE